MRRSINCRCSGHFDRNYVRACGNEPANVGFSNVTVIDGLRRVLCAPYNHIRAEADGHVLVPRRPSKECYMDVTNLLSQFGAGASGYHDAAYLESQRANEGERFRSEQAQRDVATESEQMQLSEQRRQFQSAAEDRAIATRYAHESAPGFSPTVEHDGTVTAPTGAPPPTAAQPVPAAAPSAPVSSPQVADKGAPGNVLPAVTMGQNQSPSTPQPVAASAIPGQTLSYTPPVTPANAPTTPSGAPSLASPPANKQSAPTAQAPGAGGRAGLLDQLAQAALRRGDVQLYNQRIAEKQKLRAEGIGEAAHLLLSGASPAEIERAYNANGSGRIMPGTLVHNGDGTINAVGIDPASGKTFTIDHYNLIHAAMSLGMIAPPTISSHPATDRQTITGPDGTVQTLTEGGKYSAVAIRGVGALVYNQSNGQGHIETPDGGTAQLNPTQAAGMREIAQINNEVAGRRAQQIPGQEGNKPPLNESRVIGDASAIWLNNSKMLKNGQLTPGRAHEIAVAINDKDPAVQVGHQRDADTGRVWSVAKFKGVTYAIAEAPTQVQAPPSDLATPAQGEALRAAIAKPAPAAVPRPVATPAATAPMKPAATSFNSKGEPDPNGNFVKSGPNLVQSDDLVIKNDSGLKALQEGLKIAIAKGDQKAIAEYNAAYAKRLTELRKRGYARGGVVSGGRGSSSIAPDEPLQPVKSGGAEVKSGTGTVKSRSFSAPPRATAADDAPIVRAMGQDSPIEGRPLDDGVTVKAMAAPLDDNQTELPETETLRADPVVVTGKVLSMRPQPWKRVASATEPAEPWKPANEDLPVDVSSLQQQTPIRIRSLKRPPVARASY